MSGNHRFPIIEWKVFVYWSMTFLLCLVSESYTSHSSTTCDTILPEVELPVPQALSPAFCTLQAVWHGLIAFESLAATVVTCAMRGIVRHLVGSITTGCSAKNWETNDVCYLRQVDIEVKR